MRVRPFSLSMALLLCGCESATEKAIHAGNSLAGEGRLNDALAAYQEAALASPDSARAATLVGNAEAALGHADKAHTWWKRALELDKKSVPAAVGLATAALERHQPAEALEFLNQVKDIQPISDEWRLVQAASLIERGTGNDAAEAITQCAAVLQNQPTLAQALYLRGSALLMLARYAEAQAAFDKLVETQRASPLGHYGLARLAAAQSRTTDALLYLKAAKAAAGAAWSPAAVGSDPAFDFVKHSAEFRELVGAPR